MDTEIVVHIYNGILLSFKKNAFWVRTDELVNLEPIVLSEVSQKEKDKSCALNMCIESRKMVLLNLFAGQ